MHLARNGTKSGFCRKAILRALRFAFFAFKPTAAALALGFGALPKVPIASLRVVDQAVDQFPRTIAGIDTVSECNEAIMIKSAVEFNSYFLGGNIHVTGTEFTDNPRHTRILGGVGKMLPGVIPHQLSAGRKQSLMVGW